MATLCNALDRQPAVNLWPLALSVGDGGFYGSVKYYYGYNHIHRSVISSVEQERLFRSLLRGKKIKVAVEIGTYNGTTTALLAHYADRVITIDTCNYIDKYPFWFDYGVYEKIDSYLVTDDEDKADLLREIDFDFAFLDGNHSEKGVRFDLECVKKCGRVLFHDYYEPYRKYDVAAGSSRGVINVVSELPGDEVRIGLPFAYWEKK